MSNERKPNTNIYAIYDAELERMHELMRTYITLPQDRHHNGTGSSIAAMGMSASGGYGANHLGSIYSRILEMQNTLIAALQVHEPLIQAKIAELALTGDADEN